MFSVSTLLFIIRIDDVVSVCAGVSASVGGGVLADGAAAQTHARARAARRGRGRLSDHLGGMISFMNEILLGKQGLLILLSNKQMM